MTTMVAELYDALREAGASEDKARRAAEAMAQNATDPKAVATKADLSEAKVEILKWMVGLIGFQTITILVGMAALIKLIH